MTTTTSADLDLLRARIAAAIGGRMAGHIERLGWSTGQLAGLLLGDHVCLVSGGSSGLRGVFAQTVQEYAGFAASVMRRAMAAFPASSGRPADGVVIVGVASPVHSSGLAAVTATGLPLRMVSAPAALPTLTAEDRAAMSGALELREYQVGQTARGADIAVVADRGFDHAALAAAVEQGLSLVCSLTSAVIPGRSAPGWLRAGRWQYRPGCRCRRKRRRIRPARAGRPRRP